ncbi:DUF4238 domain-containing protein [Leptospira idonii]|uniref:DUF4238 domain-containing protein n=1 Tax=Leptospira idonii TaxID=1193500 RepID=A0A4R9M1U8_9LEPT|nr:DUF4238 domain-containing protein [Leptospira idonii]
MRNKSRCANIAHRNHYIPEFYSKRFSNYDTGKIYRYMKVHGSKITEDEIYPKETGYLIDSTSFTSDKYKSKFQIDHLEINGYSKIDQDAAKSLEKQLKQGSEHLNIAERKSWALFINSLLHRSPQKILLLQDTIKKGYNEALKKITDDLTLFRDPTTREMFIKKIKSRFPLAEAEDGGKLQHLNYIIKSNFTQQILSAPLWVNTEVPLNEFLVTSDYPVVCIADPATKKNTLYANSINTKDIAKYILS